MADRPDALWSGYLSAGAAISPEAEAGHRDLPSIQASLRGVLFADKPNGGYLQAYKDDALGISYSVNANSRNEAPTQMYMMDGDERRFSTLAEFKAAYYERYPERLQAALEAMKTEKAEQTNG